MNWIIFSLWCYSSGHSVTAILYNFVTCQRMNLHSIELPFCLCHIKVRFDAVKFVHLSTIRLDLILVLWLAYLITINLLSSYNLGLYNQWLHSIRMLATEQLMVSVINESKRVNGIDAILAWGVEVDSWSMDGNTWLINCHFWTAF